MNKFKAFLILFVSMCVHVMATECKNCFIDKYKEDIIGNWVVGDSLYIVTPKYVLYVPGKKMKCSYRTEVKGETVVYDITPSKHFYAISKEGDYIFRAMRWYRIEGSGNDIRLDNRKFLITIGPIKIFSFDGGGVLKKISDDETINRLKEYDLDYNIIKSLPIETHQKVPSNAIHVYDTEYDAKIPIGLTKIEDNSLPEIITKFSKQNNK